MNKLYTIIILAIISCSNVANAQVPNWAWAKGAGGTGLDVGKSITADVIGNVYVTGHYTSPSITFGTTTLTNAGVSNMFIVKYDASGTVLWAKGEGGTSYEYVNGIATDASGNVYLTGSYESPTITFGAFTLTNASQGQGKDMFIVKYDAWGTVLWAKGAGSSAWENGYSITADAIGNVFVTGYFNSPSITFGTTTLTNSGASNSDMFIVKYDTSGTVLWAKGAGGAGTDFGHSTATDASGNVFVTGPYDSPTITFGAFTLTNASQGSDMFIVKYDTSGTVLWAKSAGGTGTDFGDGTATDASGNVYVTGYYTSTSITFGTTTLTNAGTGTSDMFIVKYDASGTVLWAKGEGGNFYDVFLGTATDASGNVYVTGSYDSSTITFGAFTLTNTGTSNSDMFIVKYDASGTVLWAKGAGGTELNDVGIGITADVIGNVFVTGHYTSPSITFGTTTLTNATVTFNSYDVFIAKLDATTGIEENAFDNGIIISPNPTHDHITINYSNYFALDGYTVKITNSLSQTVFTTTIRQQQSYVDLSRWSNGIYFVHLIDATNNIVEIKKIIIQ